MRYGAQLWLWIVASMAGWVLVPTFVSSMQAHVVTSDSMQPFIRPGDAVLVKALPFEEIVEGMILTVERPSGQRITHRVHWVDPTTGMITTKGDANTNKDGPLVGPDDVVGQVRFLVPYAGLPVLFAHRGQFVHLAVFVISLSAAATLALRAPIPDPSPRRSEEGDATERARAPRGRWRRWRKAPVEERPKVPSERGPPLVLPT